MDWSPPAWPSHSSKWRRRYFVVELEGVDPQVDFRLTDNWLELTVRFLTSAHGVREVQDARSREILRDLDGAGIGIASATFEIVGLPPLRVDMNGVAAAAGVACGEFPKAIASAGDVVRRTLKR